MQKRKICMVGDFAVGKTSLTQKFVNNVFSDKYLTTVGVKIDTVSLDQTKLVVWDIAGRDSLAPINAHYLIGAAGVVLVADGTRKETIIGLESLKATVEEKIGKVPMVAALNKCDDLNYLYEVEDMPRIDEKGERFIATSALEGTNVETLFMSLVDKMMRGDADSTAD